MSDLLARIEGLGPVAALKASFVAYPLVNAAHIMAIGAVVTLVALIDLRVLGLFSAFDAGRFVGLFRRLALAAFALAAATGLALFSVRAGHYAGNPAFLAKMALLALAGLNLGLFALLGRRTAAAGGIRAARRALAAFSLFLWPAILVAGRFIGFV